MPYDYDLLENPLRELPNQMKLNQQMPEYGGREYGWAPVRLTSGAATNRFDRSLDTQKVPALILRLNWNRVRLLSKHHF